MAQGDPLKWSMPGWRIEQRYANGVLIGNWSEERHKVGHDKLNTTASLVQNLYFFYPLQALCKEYFINLKILVTNNLLHRPLHR